VTVGFSKSDIPMRAKEDFPELEDFTRIHAQQFFWPRGLVPHDNKIRLSTVGRKEESLYKEERIIYADQNLFNFFSIPLVIGDANKVLAEGGAVVLSESKALKYFGQTNPIGKLLKLNDSLTLKVTGVFKNLPHNTHLQFDIVISNTAYLTTWAKAFNSPTMNYVRVREGVSFQEFETKLNKRKEDYFAALKQRITNTDIDMFVQPLRDIIFSENFPGDDFTSRSKSLLITFATISIIILAMAWVNYINLWLACNRKREKELATRKINGARNKDFIFQFVTESALINLLAVLLAITLLQVVRLPFQTLFHIQIAEFWQLNVESQIIFGVVLIISIFLTGLYPALMAQKNNLLGLFGKGGQRNFTNWFTSSLVVLQYSAAITLILWSSFVHRELNHILDQEVGFNRENILMVEVPTEKNAEASLDGIINRLATNPSFEIAAYSLFAPGESDGTMNTRRTGSTTQVGFEWNGVSQNYLPLFGLKMLAGRNFVASDRDDVVILSDIAAQRLGFQNPVDAVGTKLDLLKSEDIGNWPSYEIIGIIKDYRTAAFLNTSGADSEFNNNEYQSQGKMFVYKNRGFEFFKYDWLAVKVKPENLDETISSIEQQYKKVFPATPFTWVFLEDRMNKVYANEKITRNQILLFVVLAMVIACLGFQGMITHKVTSRTKEIGIRKVLGASIAHIGKVILQPSFFHIGISIVIGMPIAWYLGNLYLQKFSERIELHWWHFASPIAILILIMLGTISNVVWKAAKGNPVEALKYE
jgi:putative ABC transport system permease protein